jgi:hypothetical protein
MANLFLITIHMPDGSRGQHRGSYADIFDALEVARDRFPGATKIDVEPVAARQAAEVPAAIAAAEVLA